MARHLLSSSNNLWIKYVSIYVEVFSIALQKLSKRTSISGDEDAISERLSLLLNEVCFKLGKSRNQELPPPFWDAPNNPVNEEELKGGKIKKRPDFSCRLINSMATSSEDYQISLHVECKRLGDPTSPTWILNENYVKNGIKRFDSVEHEYGKRADSGMMIGYIIGMTPEKIESEVNEYQRKHLPEYMKIRFLFDRTSPFETCQDIIRKNVLPTRFELIHLWVDLRHCYQRTD